MADNVPFSTAAPVGQPPLMEVGYNYTWPFNRYGQWLGPIDTENNPPQGLHSNPPVWLDPVKQPPEGSLIRNLKILRDELKITKVRIFLLGNAFNYGVRPTNGVNAKGEPISSFIAPPNPDPLFASHFTQLVQTFKDQGMQMIPSLIDFGAFFPDVPGTGGAGKTDIIINQTSRTNFLILLMNLLKAAQQVTNANKTIFAFEVVNEPVWNTFAFPFGIARPHTTTPGPDFAAAPMAGFIQQCLQLIHNANFDSTIGHRFLSDNTGPMSVSAIPNLPPPVPTKPQFHYYAKFPFDPGMGPANGIGIPLLADLAGDPKTKDAFMGEMATSVLGGHLQQFKSEPGAQWPECFNLDNSVKSASFQRLALLARKGYKLAFVWPDLPDTDPEVGNNDKLKLSDDAKESIKKFTRGRFPNGVPPDPFGPVPPDVFVP